MGLDVENYNNNRGIYSPLVVHGKMVCGFWMVGNDYRNKSKMYGAYPPSYLKRLSLLFPDPKNVLHMFSGMVEKGTWPGANETTFDIRPEMKPDVLGNAENALRVFKFQEGIFDLIVGDPPYDLNHLKYGTPTLRRSIAMHQCSFLLKKGGHLVWLDTVIPIWAKHWGIEQRGAIGLQQSTNHHVRVIGIWEKVR